MEISNILNGDKIDFFDLSSGEKVLVSLVFFLYTSKEHEYFPKLLLLDEPDAHLHPSMTRQFLNVIKNVFVDQLGIRVILTTHSPSTVALAPFESLFEMHRISPRIVKSVSRHKTISILTEGLVLAGPGSKYFLVEDADDADFYKINYDHLISKDLLKGMVPLVFIPASTTSKSGGKSQVYDWVQKLQSSGLDNLVQGIIDRDAGNASSSGVHILDRYSFENYLIDPLIVYTALMDSENHPEIASLSFTIGDEYLLSGLSDTQLQLIADAILAIVEPKMSEVFDDFDDLEKERLDVKLITGQTVKYPQWLLQRKGKTLLNEVFNKAFSGNKVHRGSIKKAMKRTFFLPEELAHFFCSLEAD